MISNNSNPTQGPVTHFVPEPLTEKQAFAVNKINEVRAAVWHGVAAEILKCSIQGTLSIDGKKLTERNITPNLAFLEDLKENKPKLADLDLKTSKLFRQIMGETYIGITQLPLFVHFNPILIAATNNNSILKELMDSQAKPLIKDLAQIFEEHGILDAILSTAEDA